MLKRTMFILFGVLVLVPLMVFAQAKLDRIKPVGASMKGRTNIVKAADSAGIFRTLPAAAEAAGLVDELKGKTVYTVFAPNDEAFAKLPTGTLENLLKPENKENLIKILNYHIVKGNLSLADVMKMKKAKTVQGQELKISSQESAWMIDNAKLVRSDIFADDGTIHVIDTVLMPKYLSKFGIFEQIG